MFQAHQQRPNGGCYRHPSNVQTGAAAPRRDRRWRRGVARRCCSPVIPSWVGGRCRCGRHPPPPRAWHRTRAAGAKTTLIGCVPLPPPPPPATSSTRAASGSVYVAVVGGGVSGARAPGVNAETPQGARWHDLARCPCVQPVRRPFPTCVWRWHRWAARTGTEYVRRACPGIFFPGRCRQS